MELRPLDDRIVIKPSQAQDKTAGGIFLPDTAKEKPMVGKVVWVGPGKVQDNGKRTPVSVKKGDEVVYGKYIGNEVEIEGEKFVIVRESDLLGVLEK
ncbi:MAG TPA: co-chaperone GroES [Sedimentisphaerales bacterium]|nr:co-chaperone GroES [Phycisphaerae bacterium]HON93279.1 co-chaperone GroES [Sedimentisphaerales bacterium]HOV77080.1 co-chaperone GroES [Sedimentisphaerales bacterium]HQG49612.1 co-chaperone GroES [Sedimentisphaerales bacterium]HQI27255.1 co-chaperone GroES [Sedimentisphaerales bacterium]